MLLGAGLPKSFYGEAANTVILINTSSSFALNYKTPVEV